MHVVHIYSAWKLKLYTTPICEIYHYILIWEKYSMYLWNFFSYFKAGNVEFKSSKVKVQSIKIK